MKDLIHALCVVLIMAVLFALGMCGYIKPVRADTIGLHVGSYHSKSGFNNTNLGMYYIHDSGATVGAYCNSESRSPLFPDAKTCQVSRYAGYTFTLPIDQVKVNLTVALIQGYGRGTTPMVLPTVAGPQVFGITPRLAFIPKIDPKRGAHVVHLMLEKEF